ncbi:rod shape-determining protein MreC [Vibrio astriarenae]|nr:rod shape-determining protein MreC [Vibrio sp. C7]
MIKELSSYEADFWQRTFTSITPFNSGDSISQPYAADSRLDAFSSVRYFLNTLVSPLHYVADTPRRMFDGFYDRFHTRGQLRNSNMAMRQEMQVLKSELLLLQQYKEENQRLRELLGSPFIRDERKVVTEVMAVDTTPYSRQVVIDKAHWMVFSKVNL